MVKVSLPLLSPTAVTETSPVPLLILTLAKLTVEGDRLYVTVWPDSSGGTAPGVTVIVSVLLKSSLTVILLGDLLNTGSSLTGITFMVNA